MNEPLKCPLCEWDDCDEIGMAIHFDDCERAKELRQQHFEDETRRRQLNWEKLKSKGTQ